MTVLVDRSFARTLDQIAGLALRGETLEVWSFDDRRSREDCEALLKQKGITARIRSAYKPLVHAFLEEIDLAGVNAIELHYPVHPAAPDNRFRLEAYPLAAMTGDRPLRFVPKTDAVLQYDVVLTRADGKRETIAVLAPNRLHVDAAGETSLSPTGWVRRSGEEEGERIETDFEQLFETAIATVTSAPWGTQEPYFEELHIAASIPAKDAPMSVGDEVISLAEALHEDLYFSLLEVFQKRSGRPLGDRGLKPGQIVPAVTGGAARSSLRIELKALSTGHMDDPRQDLDRAETPLAVAQVTDELAGHGGVAFEASTRSGRTVRATYVAGTAAPVMISAGQHANETTGVVGALRAARRLARREGAHFSLSPLENPDGYALHQRLRLGNPRHMHHAARYTALGDDLEYRTRENSGATLFEKEIRIKAEALSGAGLHVNLHGYPAHEWTRPLSGYVPRNFAMWTLPKGFFLILRHLPGWETASEALLDKVTRHLAAIPGLVGENSRQIALYEAHAGETGFRMINGFPCLCSLDDRHTVPVTLITEYPDETIYGPAFRTGHTAQMETVLAAYEAWQEILTGLGMA
jgi:hypothetical protein